MPDVADDVDNHPIIFNAWSIRRILAGGKTQTRRIVKPQPPHNEVHGPEMYTPAKVGPGGKIVPGGDQYGVYGASGEWGVKCPYGQPGDVLWVRESFQLPLDKKDMAPKEYVETYQKWAWKYRFPADGTKEQAKAASIHFGRKRPSIHMPRELCRLRLRVKDVRVERVQDIAEADAKAEGVDYGPVKATPNDRKAFDTLSARDSFRNKWNDIHGDGAWERNDWVWVVEFSRIDTDA